MGDNSSSESEIDESDLNIGDNSWIPIQTARNIDRWKFANRGSLPETISKESVYLAS